MMTVQVLRTLGDYGSFVAAIVDGERVDPPGNGQIAVRLPPGEVVLTIYHPNYANREPATYRVEQSTFFPAVMMDETDPASGTRWHQLVANGTITPEMLAEIPEPEAEILARLKTDKLGALNAWFKAMEATPWLIPDTSYHLSFDPNDGRNYKAAIDAQELRIDLDRVTRAEARVTWFSVELQPIVCTVAQARDWIADYFEAREQLAKDYAQAAAQIEAATTVEEFNAIVFGTSP